MLNMRIHKISNSIRTQLSLRACAFTLLTLAISVALCQVHVTENRYNKERTGENTSESVLTQAALESGQFGKLANKRVDRPIWGHPLYVAGIDVQGRTRNVVYVTTSGLSVYAFDADDYSEVAPLWYRKIPGTPPFATISGLLSTPVIDLDSQTMFVVAKVQSGPSSAESSFKFWLYAFDLVTGADKPNSPVEITAIAPGNGDSKDGAGSIRFVPRWHMQRPGLAISNGKLYILFGSSADVRPCHGWVMAYDTSSLQQVHVFATTPNSGRGGIWMSGCGPSFDAAGNLYLATGNGIPFTPVTEWGSAVLKLSPTLQVLDYFVPFNYNDLNKFNLDLGSAGVVLIPGTNRAITAGKQGKVYLMNTNDLGKVGATSDRVVQSFQAFEAHLHCAPTLFHAQDGSVTVFAWAEEDFLKGYKFLPNGTLNLDFTLQSEMRAPDGMPGGALTVTSNNRQSGTGLLWASLPLIGDGLMYWVPGALRVFNPVTLEEIWNSNRYLADEVGYHTKFASATVVNGKVFLPTCSNQLAIYGMRNQSAPAPPAVMVGSPGDGLARLAWTNTPNADSYIVERATSPTGTYVPIAELAEPCLVSPLPLKTVTYSFRVRSKNGSGTSAPSPLASVRSSTTASTALLDFPTLTAADASKLKLNGSARLAGDRLDVVDSGVGGAGSAWCLTRPRFSAFRARFRFSFAGSGVHGLTFALHSNTELGLNQTNSLGGPESELGYGPDPLKAFAVRRSVAVKFARDDDFPAGVTGMLIRGRTATENPVPISTPGLDLNAGNEFEVGLVYDGALLTVTITDTVTRASQSNAYTINATVEAGAGGWIGFTGSADVGSSVRVSSLTWGPY